MADMGHVHADLVGATGFEFALDAGAVSYTHLRAHETVLDLVCRLLLEKKKNKVKRKLDVLQGRGR